jgi:dolichol-phosphate mannosyltransferase
MGRLHEFLTCDPQKEAGMENPRWLTAIPVYNEAKHVRGVLAEVRRYAPDILVIDDGSTDDTPRLLDSEPNVARVTHSPNRGYGAAIATAFRYAIDHGYEILVTMDCDGQHEPARIPVLLEAIHDADIVSGSRYLRDFRQDTPPPTDRRSINATITREINARHGLNLTDAFCGFKAYRVPALRDFRITEAGWGMPLQLWVQAARLGLRVKEVGVPRLYLDPNRAFGGVLNDPTERLAYYRGILASEDASAISPPTPSCQLQQCPEIG